MSALAVYLEQQGIATVVIGLVRLHLEKIQPPRALWVPFELGRPLGPPNNPAFQQRVLRAALKLLEADKGPVVLQNFPDDEPGIEGDPAWSVPSLTADSIMQEVQQLQPLYAQAVAQSQRTTVGISALPIIEAADYVQRYGSAEAMPNPHPELSDLALLRFAGDDLKAFYLEAATALPGLPSSRQLLGWFWQQTRLANRLREVRELLRSSEESKQRQMADSLIPRAWL